MALLTAGSLALAAEGEEDDAVALEPEPAPQAGPARASDFSEARSLLVKQKWSEAAIMLRTVLKSEPYNAQATLGLARALTYSGRREEALTVLAQGAARARGARKKTYERRRTVIARMFLTNPTFQDYQYGLNFLHAGKYRLARERFEKAQYVERDNLQVLVRLAQCEILDSHAIDAAIERLEIARRLDPVEPEIRLWLGRALQLRGDQARALPELRAAYAADRQSELAPLWLADSLLYSGSRPAAIRVLEDDVRAQPFHLQSLEALARLRLLSIGRDPEPLWAARKDLQVAMSRLSKYLATPTGPARPGISELSVDLRPSAEEMTADLQKLQIQVEARLKEAGASKG